MDPNPDPERLGNIIILFYRHKKKLKLKWFFKFPKP